MTFTEVILYMLGAAKASTRNALERAFKKENMTITQQAFSAARQKIKWEAIEELFQASAEGSCNEGLASVPFTLNTNANGDMRCKNRLPCCEGRR